MKNRQIQTEERKKYTWEDIDDSVEFYIDLDKEINVFYDYEYNYVLKNMHLLDPLNPDLEKELLKHVRLTKRMDITDFQYYMRKDFVPLVPGFYIHDDLNKCYVII